MLLERFEYVSLEEFYRDAPNELRPKCVSARHYASVFWNNADDDEFIVITIAGKNCLAHIEDEFTPYEISDRVIPFDEKRVYQYRWAKKVIAFADEEEM